MKNLFHCCMCCVGIFYVTTIHAGLESPAGGATQSGISVVRGWYCDAENIEIVFDEHSPIKAAYGTVRKDTEGICGDTNNGFGLLWNYALLGQGQHRVRAYADGLLFADRTFSVGLIGDGGFLRGAEGNYVLKAFPDADREVTITWTESAQNFTATGTHSIGEVQPDVGRAYAGDFLGEYCWRWSGWNFQLGLSSAGGSHIDVRGKGIRNDGVEEAFHGNLELRTDGKMIMLLTTSGEESTGLWSGTLRAILDSDLNGTLKSFMQYYVYESSQIQHNYWEGNFISIPCQ